MVPFHKPINNDGKIPTQTRNDSIRGLKVGSTLPATIQNQHLMSHQDGLGNNGTKSTGLDQPDHDNNRMQKESENVAHCQDDSTSHRIQRACGIRLPQVQNSIFRAVLLEPVWPGVR
jgi:hypothetical protein